MSALVSTDWLAEHLHDPDLRIVDVRWKLDAPRYGRENYLAGHIPGAIFFDVERDLSAPGGMRGGPRGRHPWPDAWQVARVMSASGIADGVTVVAYDDQGGAYAARVWFLLRAYGFDAGRVLDGGIPKWIAEKRPLDTTLPEVAPREFVPRPVEGLVLQKADLLAQPPDALIIDARAPERYRGDAEPIDPRAGHVPGAVNVPFVTNLTTARTFRTPAELRATYAAFGAEEREAICYCGSGVTACHDILALHEAGLRGRLYAGSWSEWSSDVRLPAAKGPAPGSREPA